MYIKINRKGLPGGIPTATVACSPMTLDNGMPQVYVGISAVDPISNIVVGSLRMSPAEARDLANRLISCACDAVTMSGKTKAQAPE